MKNTIQTLPGQPFLLLFAASLALSYFMLVPLARAVSPLPDGGYPGSNTAEGDDALFSLTTGSATTTIPPTKDAESAILMTLTPDAYTAIVRGKDNTTGVALVEAYQLDN